MNVRDNGMLNEPSCESGKQGAEKTVLATAPPLFIVGFQRSGTTLLRMMLNAHPQIAIPHDSAELWSKYRLRVPEYNQLSTASDVLRMIKDIRAEPRIGAWQAELPEAELVRNPLPDTFAAVMARFHEVFAREKNKHIWGDKNTGTLVELDELNLMFPNARFIHIVRDGRDCALSHVGKVYTYGYENILRVAKEWKEQVGLCRKMGRMLPRARFCELRYEDLIAHPESSLRTVCQFLGVEYSERMLCYHEDVGGNIPSEKQNLWPLLNRPPDTSNIYKWRTELSRVDRAIFDRVAGDLLRIYGYETLKPPVRDGRVRQVWYEFHQRIAWRLKGSGALMRRKKKR